MLSWAQEVPCYIRTYIRTFTYVYTVTTYWQYSSVVWRFVCEQLWIKPNWVLHSCLWVAVGWVGCSGDYSTITGALSTGWHVISRTSLRSPCRRACRGCRSGRRRGRGSRRRWCTCWTCTRSYAARHTSRRRPRPAVRPGTRPARWSHLPRWHTDPAHRRELGLQQHSTTLVNPSGWWAHSPIDMSLVQHCSTSSNTMDL